MPPPPCIPPRASSPITGFPWTQRSTLNGCLIDRDLSCMGDLCPVIQLVRVPPPPSPHGILALYRPEAPSPRPAQRCHPAYILHWPPPHSPINRADFNPSPGTVHQKGPGFHSLNPERERGHVLIFP